MSSYTVKGITLLSIIVLIWGSTYFFISVSLEIFKPAQISFFRAIIGLTVLLILKKLFKIKFKSEEFYSIQTAAVGLLGIALPLVLAAQAQRYVSTSVVSVLATTAPMFVYIIGYLLKIERKSLMASVGTVTAIIGVALLNYGGLTTSKRLLIWQLVIVLVGLLLATSNIITRIYLKSINPLNLVTYQFIWATPIIFAYMIFFEGVPNQIPNSKVTFSLLFLGVAGSAIAYWIFAILINGWSSSTAATNTYLQPIVGCLLGFLILGERLQAFEIAGMVVTMIGVTLFALKSPLFERNRLT